MKLELDRALRSAIQFDPVTRDLPERIAKQIEVDGFLDITVASEIVGSDQVCGFARGRPYNDWHRLDERLGADTPKDFVAI